MHWFQTLDVALFRWLNLGLSNPAFDTLMPIASGNEWSRTLCFTLAAVGAYFLVCKGRARGRICLLMLVLVLAIGDGFICNTIKHAVARPRPFLALPEAHCLIGKGGSGSMPSSHAANWFSAAMVLFIYYRRSLGFMLPMAILVSFSRVYNGVHYPSDVLAGAILGAGYSVAVILLVNGFWCRVGQDWFPLWWKKLPSLLNPTKRVEEAEEEPVFAPRKARQSPAEHPKGWTPNEPPPARHATVDEHWLRLGYICVAMFLLGRLAYIASGTIQLAEDEAYQWLWSKHLALSYFSKPLLIAYTQFLGTSIWGDTPFGIRFFSPVITAIMSLVLLRFFAREVNARAGFFLMLIATATPLLSLGAVVMTVDPLSVLFWTAAMLAGWGAIQENATTKDWLWVGLWMGLGFLSKYTELLQLLCWAVLFVLWPPARKQLRRAGPYLALLVNALCTLPVVIWNAQRDWITVKHVAADAGVNQPWTWKNLLHFPEFLGMEFGLMNPIFFVAAAWAAIAFWRRSRNNPRLVYFFSMGAPLFLAYTLHSFRSRLLPNWIAPSVIPLFCLMVVYWDTRLRMGEVKIKRWLAAGLVLGFAVVLALHNTDVWQVTLPARRLLAKLTSRNEQFIARFTGRYLPVNLDPLHRVRVWSDVAQAVGEARRELEAEGKPTFIIAEHYGMASQVSFYLPEAKARVSDTPLVYFRSTPRPNNQFGFWPGYGHRKGENAIYFRELDRVTPNPTPAPERVQAEFESVTDLGVTNVMYHGQVCRPLQLFACRGLK